MSDVERTPAGLQMIIPGCERRSGLFGQCRLCCHRKRQLAFSLSLHHELADKRVRVQAVLPGATATDFWDAAGVPLHHLPAAIVMSADDMVDAALAGLDQGEIVTIPSLADKADWDTYEAARRAMSGKLSSAVPAPRYSVGATAVAPKAAVASAK